MWRARLWGAFLLIGLAGGGGKTLRYSLGSLQLGALIAF